MKAKVRQRLLVVIVWMTWGCNPLIKPIATPTSVVDDIRKVGDVNEYPLYSTTLVILV